MLLMISTVRFIYYYRFREASSSPYTRSIEKPRAKYMWMCQCQLQPRVLYIHTHCGHTGARANTPPHTTLHVVTHRTLNIFRMDFHARAKPVRRKQTQMCAPTPRLCLPSSRFYTHTQHISYARSGACNARASSP